MKRGILFCAFYSLVRVSSSFAAPQVRLGDTTVTGQAIPSLQQDFFGGIPFANIPVGNLRLKPPVLKTKLDVKEFNASSYGYACVQPPPFPAEFMSEDCLTINIFRPSGIGSDAKLPVMFWTYGGGFQIGASGVFNGSALIAHSVARGTPIVFVSFNYRLGPLGFPQGKEADGRRAVNLGLLDQIAALEWVQHNIAAFGGDKDKVTAFGESAGSIMTSILFLDRRIEGLARAGIFESGHAMSAGVSHAERHETDWQNFVRGVPSCSSLATTGNAFSCLQAADSSDIIQGLLASITESPEEFPWVPVLDGQDGIVPDYASRRFPKGEFARLPFIAGTNLDEGTYFAAPPLPQFTSEDDIIQTLTANYSPPVVSPQTLQSHIKTLLQLYPNIPALGSPYNTGNNTFGLSSLYKQYSAIFGDLVFQSQRRFWSHGYSNAGIKTYGYLFTEPQTNSPPLLGVFHASELTSVFGNVTGFAPLSPNATNLSGIMMDYWISFATSLDPNDGHGMPRPKWEAYTSQNQALLQLNSQNLVMIPDNYRKEQINFINSNPLVWLH